MPLFRANSLRHTNMKQRVKCFRCIESSGPAPCPFIDPIPHRSPWCFHKTLGFRVKQLENTVAYSSFF